MADKTKVVAPSAPTVSESLGGGADMEPNFPTGEGEHKGPPGELAVVTPCGAIAGSKAPNTGLRSTYIGMFGQRCAYPAGLEINAALDHIAVTSRRSRIVDKHHLRPIDLSYAASSQKMRGHCNNFM